MGIAKVWVYAEADGEDPDKPHSSTLELLTKAREVGDWALNRRGPEFSLYR